MLRANYGVGPRFLLWECKMGPLGHPFDLREKSRTMNQYFWYWARIYPLRGSTRVPGFMLWKSQRLSWIKCNFWVNLTENIISGTKLISIYARRHCAIFNTSLTNNKKLSFWWLGNLNDLKFPLVMQSWKTFFCTDDSIINKQNITTIRPPQPCQFTTITEHFSRGYNLTI
jgi:hypothetical protein